MRLKLVLPARELIDLPVDRVSAESDYGTFTILPNHIDFATILTSGLLSYRPVEGTEEYLAVDEGVVVKTGDQVLVSTSNAIPGHDLGELRKLVETEFRRLSDRERKARTALARLESDFIRHYMEFQE